MLTRRNGPIITALLLLQLFGVVQSYAQENSSNNPLKFKVGGSAEIRLTAYAATGIENRRSPFSYLLSANPVFSFGVVDVPLSFSYSEQDKKFRQPFNQFGLSPTYKWAKIHLGYRNIDFSPYTLAGHTMMGAGAELNPKKFRIGIMYGRLNRSTDLDTSTGIMQPYSFSRKGLAAKIGYGSEQSFFEFSALKAKDDSNSIKKIPDSLKTILPAENLVVGFSSRLKFLKKFFVQADGAGSIYTRNTQSTIIDSTNNKLIKSVKSLINVNGTSELNFAYSASVGVKEDLWSAELKYKHIDPEFESMGAYYFQNDIEQWTIAPAIRTKNSKLSVNASLGFQKDNLRSQKSATTKRFIGNLGFNAQINQLFGISGSYNNYSLNAKPEVVNINNKYLLTQSNNSISLVPRFVKVTEKMSHVITLVAMQSGLVDKNTDTKSYTNFTTQVATLNYSLTLLSKAITFTPGLNFTNVKTSQGVVHNKGASLSVQKSLLKNDLSLGVNGAFIQSSRLAANNIINAGVNANYKFLKQHTLVFRYAYINNKPVLPVGAFQENTGELSYQFNF